MIDIRLFIEPSHGGNITTALDLAVAKALEWAERVYIPAGWWTFKTPPKPIGGGVTIVGESGMQSAHTGTCLNAAYHASEDAPFLCWDGSDPRGYKGTGGGIRDLTIYKYGTDPNGKGWSGGCAIKVVCTNNTTSRAGMWTLENVAVISENKGLWDRILLVDGSAIPKGDKGGMGIRTVTLKSPFFSGADFCTVELKNVVHFNWFGGQVQQGPVKPANQATVKVNGYDSQDIHIFTSVYGLVHFQECQHFNFDGLAIKVQVDKGASNGYVKALQCTNLINNGRDVKII